MAKGNPDAPALDKKAFEGLLRLQCTRDEVMLFFGLKSKTSLVDWVKSNYGGCTFEEIAQQYNFQGKIGLKRQAYERAKKSDSVLIFLLKSELHMSEDAPAQPEDNSKYTNELMKSIDKAAKTVTNRTDLIAGIPTRKFNDEGEEVVADES